jgi:hypothetical protein
VITIASNDLPDGAVETVLHMRRIFQLPASVVLLVHEYPDLVEEIQLAGASTAERVPAEVVPQHFHIHHIAAQEVFIMRYRVSDRIMRAVQGSMQKDSPAVETEVPVLEAQVPKPNAQRTLIGRAAVHGLCTDAHAV